MSDPRTCPVCDTEHSSLFKEFRGMRLYACAGCGTVFLDPLPADDEAHGYYNNTYANATESYFTKIDKKMHRGRRRMRELARLVRRGRFLDIGCNGGFMVEVAREAGFEAHGLDVDPISVAYAEEHYPGGHYFLGPVETYAASAPAFELIYCSEVIEHVPRVGRFMAAIAALLAPGGVFYVTTPDIGHWRRPRDIEAWDGFCPPAHCIFFRPAGLRALLARHGLDVIRTKLAWKPGIKMIARRRT